MKSSIIIVGAIAIASSAIIYNIVTSDSDNLVSNQLKKLITSEEKKLKDIQKEAEVLAPVGLSRSLYTASNLETGYIGINAETNIDNPHDNTFHIILDGEIESGRQAWLEYDLYGVEDYTSVSRAINDQVAIGGAFVKLSQDWSVQREKIDASQLHKGDNIVRFSIPGNSDFNYIVKNVRIRFDEDVDASRRIVLNQPMSKSYYNRYGYISGFVSGNGSEHAKIYANGKPVRSNQSVFEGIVDQIADHGSDWKAVITAVFEDGQTISDTAHFCNPATCDFTNEISTDLAFNETKVNDQIPVHMNIPGFELNGEPGSVNNNVTLSVTGLRAQDMALPRLAMVNVTGGSDGYRCLPHGNNFAKEVEVRVKYDTTRIPKGYGPKDIRTFYYSEEQGDWIQLPYDTFDLASCEIISHTTHFTDFINAILKTPESPQTQAFTPTSMKDMKFADPVAHINMMSPPQANNSGTANMSYPIQIPAGRQGMQPQLAITYNSEGGNGWLGVGWGMNIPSISVETRWGVPHYYPNLESESYLVNGEQILELNDTNRLKLVHRDTYRARSTDTAEYYSYRVEGSVDKIIRHGTSPDTYWWEVVDKQGVRYFYGKYVSDLGVNSNCVLQDSVTGNIAHWALSEVLDLNGNNVKYFYSIDKRTTAPGAGGIEIYPDSIKYTGFNQTEGKYKINFNYIGSRSDYTISGRYGFLQVTDRLLENITVYYEDEFVRAYSVKYDNGAYGKKLICAIADITDTARLDITKNYDCVELTTGFFKGVKVHGFEYYEETEQSFDSAVVLSNYIDDLDFNMLNNLFELPTEATVGYNLSNGKSVGGSLGVGLLPKVFDKSNSLGGNYAYAESKSSTKMMIADINGDGLPDKVFQMPDGIYYRKLVFNGDNLTYYSSPVKMSGLPAIGMTSSTSETWGLEGQLAIVGASYASTSTQSITPRYFSDVNADGLMDYIDEGKIYYNQLNSSGDPVFTLESSDEEQYVFGDTCSYILRTGTVNDSIYTPYRPTKIDLENGYYRDGVRVWIAPYTGSVILNSSLQLVEDTSYSRQQSTKANGIKYLIQHNGSILTQSRVYATDYAAHSYLDTLTVTKGDRLYFRLQSMMDRSWDNVIWDPRISYTTIGSVVDADNKKIGIFKPSDDLLIKNKQFFQAPYSGKVMIKGTMTSTALSDTMFFRVKHGNTIITQSTFPDNTTINYSLFDSIDVEEGDSILFEAFTSTNVNWNGISENFKIYYYYADSVNIDTNSVYNKIEVRAMVQYHLFQNVRQKSVPVYFSSGTYTMIPKITAPASANGTLIWAIKKDHDLIAKKQLTVVNGVLQTTPNFSFTSTGSNYYFEYYTEDPDFADLITSAKARKSRALTEYDAGFHTMYPDSMWKFGNLYHGWGQFSYFDTYDTLNQTSPINESLLHLNQLYTDSTLITFDTTNITCPDSAISALSADDLNRPNSVPFNMMFPDLDSMVWRDYAVSSSVGRQTMSNAGILISTTDTVYDSPIIINNDPNVSMRAIRLASAERNEAYSVSANIGAVSGGIAWNDAWSTSVAEYTDLNGDQYPDIVGQSYVQFSTPQGGIWPNVTSLLSGNIENNTSSGNGVSAGVSLPISSSNKNRVVYASVFMGSPLNITVRKTKKKSFLSGSGSVYNTESEGTFLLADMNGDGLPDKINKNTGNIFLSKGYSYSSGETWNMVTSNVDNTQATDFSVSAGQQIETGLQNILQLGTYNKAEYSWSGGVGLGFSNSERQFGLMDMNNDGLTDIVAYDGGSSLLVYINNGNGSNNNQTTWTDGGNINKNKTISASANISGSAGFPVFVVKIVGGLQVSASGSISMEKLTIMDMNNDGYPDIVYADSLSTKVRYSKMGKVNVLRQVTTPVGSKYIVDYTMSKCDNKMPSRQWDMTSLKVFDGFAGDGQDTTYQKFAYEGGYFDRFERTSYGYDSVITMQFDNFTPSGDCYRSTVERYHNDDFLFKGLKKYEVTVSGSGKKYVETVYTWKKLEISSGDVVTNETCFGPYYPGLVKEDTYFYEGQSAYQIHTKKTYAYGIYGNVDEYINFGDTTNPTHKITAQISYVYDTNLNLLSMVDQLDVYDYNNTLIQRRAGDYDNKGNITKIGTYNGSVYVNTEYTYDTYGNITYVQYPPDVNNERLEYTYEYDNDVYTYPEKITDYWGNYSQAWYDLRLGVVTKVRDITNNYMEYSYYIDGKPKTVTAPKEIAANIPYTIKFEYWDETPQFSSNAKWARTRHYDPLNPGNEFITVNFSDGVGRSVQSKQKTTINGNDSMVVSGLGLYDEYGRIDSVSLPVTQALGTDSIFDVFNPSHFSSTVYDTLDRPVVQTAPDNTQVSYQYGFGTDAFGDICFSTTVTDPNNKVATSYSDARGLKTSTTAPLTTITKFYYDPLGKLIQSTDPDANSTYYNYDMLGRLTSRSHPDAGTTSYTYDLAGNVLTTQTQILSGSSQYIQYNYSAARLSSIVYPQNPEMNVYYEYGSPNSGTQSGRLVKQQDASGMQTFKYGNMGELIENIHTFVVPGGSPYTFETRWTYDSWNRMDSIYYPDGEMVAYHYDNGGKLVSMDGVKGSQNFNYVDDVKYNMYGSRTRIDYGNSTYALYTYNPLNQRLTTLKSYDANDSLMQNINYGYDAASNITSIENVAGSLNNGLGGICLNYFTYDDLYRLTNSYGAFASANNGPLYQSLDMTYSASGNILSKEVSAQKEIGGAIQNVNYSNTYAYGGRPHTVTSAGSNDYEWDENGNMIMRSDGNDTRRLCWDEENRLTTVRDDGEQGMLSSYIYNAGGERTWKLAGDAYAMYINGQYQYGGAMLMKTLYSSPYMVLTDEEYSKHYFIEGERVCSKIGGGFALAAITPSSTQNFLVNDETQVATELWDMVRRGIDCTGFPPENVETKKELRSAENLNDDAEINQYFYHSDHLGSSSFITDATGNATQHLQYLSFGETWIDQQSGSFDSRYKFSAKELDDETQYSYFGARYYDSDLSVWLSVDPMSDARSWISPYNYCQWNPVGRVDPSGALDGDYFAVDGTYLGNDGYNDKMVYVVDNVPEIKYDQSTLRDFKKLYEDGTMCFDPLNPPEVQKLSLDRDELLNRARWFFGEGAGLKQVGTGRSMADFYAWTIKNKKTHFKSENETLKSAMGRNYESFMNGTFYTDQDDKNFWNAQQRGDINSLYSSVPQAKSIIASIIQVDIGIIAVDPTNGATGWLGGGKPNHKNDAGENTYECVRVVANDPENKCVWYHYFHSFKGKK